MTSMSKIIIIILDIALILFSDSFVARLFAFIAIAMMILSLRLEHGVIGL